MNDVSTPAPAELTTLQDIEEFADATGQDFYALLAQRAEVLKNSTVTEVHQSAMRLGVRASSIVAVCSDQASDR